MKAFGPLDVVQTAAVHTFLTPLLRTARSSWPQSRRSTSLRTEFPMIGLVIVTHGRLAHEFSAALMSTKSRQTIYGGPIMGARIRADGARKRAAEAVRQARWTLEFECVPE